MRLFLFVAAALVGSITGTIKTDQGRPAANVIVSVEGSPVSVRTDGGGRFTMFRRAKRMLEDVPTEVLEAAAARPVDQYACRLRPGLVEGWVTAGARFVGGCCGTGPTDIAALADRVSGLSGPIPRRRGGA